MGYKQEITIQEAKQIIIDSIHADMLGFYPYKPILIEGPSGIGKSSIISQSAKELEQLTGKKFKVYDFRSGQINLQDLYGVPSVVRTQDESYVEYYKPKEYPGVMKESEDDYGIFFMDELTTTKDKQVLAGLLQILTDKKIAGYTLPKNWYIVAAANRREDGNVYGLLPFPVRNRLEIYEVKFDKKIWLEYLKEINTSKFIIDYISNCVNDNEFLTYNPELENYGINEDNNYVCATPRTWENLDKKIKGMLKLTEHRNTTNHPASTNPQASTNHQASTSQTSSTTQYILLDKIVGGILGKELGDMFLDFYYSSAEKESSTSLIDVKINELQRNFNGTNELIIPTLEDIANLENLLYEVIKSNNQNDNSYNNKVIKLLSYYNLTQNTKESLSYLLENKEILNLILNQAKLATSDKDTIKILEKQLEEEINKYCEQNNIEQNTNNSTDSNINNTINNNFISELSNDINNREANKLQYSEQDILARWLK